MLRDATLGACTKSWRLKASISSYTNRTESYYLARLTVPFCCVRSMSRRLRGTNLTWFGIDELSCARPEAWLRLEARLRDPRATRLRGFGVWTPQGHDWIYRRFIENPVAGYECVRAQPFETVFF